MAPLALPSTHSPSAPPAFRTLREQTAARVAVESGGVNSGQGGAVGEGSNLQFMSADEILWLLYHVTLTTGSDQETVGPASL